LFRYPGIRSDSDMYTLGFSHRPWEKAQPIAPGAEIRNYVKTVAREDGLDKHISYHKEVVAADYNRDRRMWTLQVKDHRTQQTVRVSCRWMHLCPGYYNYEEPYRPTFPGEEQFRGSIIHPQLWDESTDCRGKRVVVIGSGATAITLIPSLADEVEHITMLQRSPSYILALPQHRRMTVFLQRMLPSRLAYFFIRWQNITLSYLLYVYCTLFPTKSKRMLMKEAKKLLPADFDAERHLCPAYNPWEQRLCIAPDADIFRSIRQGKASIVTDHIDRFVENGILLKSGEVLEADMVIAATGLNIKLLGGIQFSMDGEPLQAANHFVYRGMMLSNIPNVIYSVGYSNASWTLRCELTSGWSARLLNHMDKTNTTQCYPALPADHTLKTMPILNLSSGYIRRAQGMMPKKGDKGPWKNRNYPADWLDYHLGSLDDGVLHFD